MTLLAINIPTYERLESFSSILIELENELNALPKAHKDIIEINIFENNSSVANQKRDLCNEVAQRSAINLKFSVNETNIGADRNILKCCCATPDATFTWVLGDDDHIVAGCFPKILSSLMENAENLGLLILMEGEFVCKTVFKDKLFKSYEDFARLSIKQQRNVVWAHSLISCNIFRSSVFDLDEATYVVDKLTPRIGLSLNFVHMRGIVNGLLRNAKEYSVLMPSYISLDCSKRLPSLFKVANWSKEFNRILYFYYLWLLGELGVRIDEIPYSRDMWWLFGPNELKGWRRWFRSPLVP